MNQQPTQPTSRTEETRRRGALVLQTLPIIFIPTLISLGLVLFFWLTSTLPEPPAGRPPRDGFGPLLPLVVIVVFLSSLIMLVRLGRATLSALLLIAVWTLGVTIATLQFGVTSYYPALLILPICAAGLLIDRVASISLAGLATLLVIGMGWLDAQGLGPIPRTPPPSLAAFFERNTFIFAASFWIGLFWSVAALTALLAGGLRRALDERSARAAELQELSAQLEARVQQQTAQLVTQARETAVLEERARFARDIHDTIAQGLAGISVQIGAAQRALQVAPDQARTHMDLAQTLARESLAEARRSVWNLRAPALERGSLGDALRGLAELQSQAGLRTQYAEHGQPRPLAPEIEAALLRVTQEGLANIARHARATHATITLDYAKQQVKLTVQDDGQGFADAEHAVVDVPGPHGGFGLAGMRERLAAVGGTLRLRNAPGAVIEATVVDAV